MSIAENIKALRTKYGLTQAELGDIAGVSDKAVSTWENGTAEPRMGSVQRIAEYFHISKGSIVDDTPSASPVDRLTASEQALLSDFRQLNKEGQTKVADYAGDLVSSGKYVRRPFDNTGESAGSDASADETA